MPGISRESHSVYLTKINTSGIIYAMRSSKGGREGTAMHITLRYPRDAIKYMLHEETEMQRILETVENEIRDFKKQKVWWTSQT